MRRPPPCARSARAKKRLDIMTLRTGRATAGAPRRLSSNLQVRRSKL